MEEEEPTFADENCPIVADPKIYDRVLDQVLLRDGRTVLRPTYKLKPRDFTV